MARSELIYRPETKYANHQLKCKAGWPLYENSANRVRYWKRRNQRDSADGAAAAEALVSRRRSVKRRRRKKTVQVGGRNERRCWLSVGISPPAGAHFYGTINDHLRHTHKKQQQHQQQRQQREQPIESRNRDGGKQEEVKPNSKKDG